MKLIVCAKSKRGLFIGLPSAAGYSVFSTHEPDAIQPGDILTSPTWDDEADLFRTVRNVTRGKEVSVEIESWSLSLDEARDLLGGAKESSDITWHPPWPGHAIG